MKVYRSNDETIAETHDLDPDDNYCTEDQIVHIRYKMGKLLDKGDWKGYIKLSGAKQIDLDKLLDKIVENYPHGWPKTRYTDTFENYLYLDYYYDLLNVLELAYVMEDFECVSDYIMTYVPESTSSFFKGIIENVSNVREDQIIRDILFKAVDEEGEETDDFHDIDKFVLKRHPNQNNIRLELKNFWSNQEQFNDKELIKRLKSDEIVYLLNELEIISKDETYGTWGLLAGMPYNRFGESFDHPDVYGLPYYYDTSVMERIKPNMTYYGINLLDPLKAKILLNKAFLSPDQKTLEITKGYLADTNIKKLGIQWDILCNDLGQDHSNLRELHGMAAALNIPKYRKKNKKELCSEIGARIITYKKGVASPGTFID